MISMMQPLYLLSGIVLLLTAKKCSSIIPSSTNPPTSNSGSVNKIENTQSHIQVDSESLDVSRYTNVILYLPDMGSVSGNENALLPNTSPGIRSLLITSIPSPSSVLLVTPMSGPDLTSFSPGSSDGDSFLTPSSTSGNERENTPSPTQTISNSLDISIYLTEMSSAGVNEIAPSTTDNYTPINQLTSIPSPNSALLVTTNSGQDLTSFSPGSSDGDSFLTPSSTSGNERENTPSPTQTISNSLDISIYLTEMSSAGVNEIAPSTTDNYTPINQLTSIPSPNSALLVTTNSGQDLTSFSPGSSDGDSFLTPSSTSGNERENTPSPTQTISNSLDISIYLTEMSSAGVNEIAPSTTDNYTPINQLTSIPSPNSALLVTTNSGQDLTSFSPVSSDGDSFVSPSSSIPSTRSVFFIIPESSLSSPSLSPTSSTSVATFSSNSGNERENTPIPTKSDTNSLDLSTYLPIMTSVIGNEITTSNIENNTPTKSSLLPLFIPSPSSALLVTTNSGQDLTSFSPGSSDGDSFFSPSSFFSSTRSVLEESNLSPPPLSPTSSSVLLVTPMSGPDLTSFMSTYSGNERENTPNPTPNISNSLDISIYLTEMSSARVTEIAPSTTKNYTPIKSSLLLTSIPSPSSVLLVTTNSGPKLTSFSPGSSDGGSLLSPSNFISVATFSAYLRTNSDFIVTLLGSPILTAITLSPIACTWSPTTSISGTGIGTTLPPIETDSNWSSYQQPFNSNGLVPSPTTVVDINECSTNNGNCSQICMNTIGSYICSCVSGYLLGANNQSCYAAVAPYFSLWKVTGSSIFLFANWSAPMPHNDIIIGYIIYCNTSANQAYPEQRIGLNTPTIRSVVNGTTLAATFSTGLNPYTEYNCYVTANTLVGEGSPSIIGTARTDEGVPIASPGNVVAITTAPTSVNVRWDQLPNTARNGMIIAHEVKYSWPLGNEQLGTIYVNTSGTSNQVVLNRLHECVQYNISVRAYTSQGPGPFSEAVCDSSLNLYPQVPQPPEVLPSALTATSANLTWSCPLEKNYAVITYSVNVTVNDPSSIKAKCVQGLNLSYNFTVPGYQRYIYLMNMSLVPFTSYSFDVLVKTIEGNGNISMPRSFITLQAPPTSPLNIKASVLSYNSLLILWSPPTCSNGIISGYMVTYTPLSGFPSSPFNVSNATALLLQNLWSNTQYTLSVCAFTMGGCGPSISVSATTLHAPSTDPSIVYLRLSTLTNIDNHQNDEALSHFQDEIIKVTNVSLHAIGINEAFTLGSLCISVQRCENDITAGTYRVECKIMIFLSLTSADIATFVQFIGSLNMSSTAIVLDGNTRSISAEGGFCSCALNVANKGGTYSWPEAVVGQTASQKCQYGVFGQNVTRYCSKQVWMEDLSVCPTVVTQEFSQLSSTVQNQTVSTDNVVNVTTQLQAVVSQATEVVDQSASNLGVVTTVITQISMIFSPNAPVSNDTIINVVAILSSIQTWPPTVVEKSGSIIVKSFEAIASSLVQKENFTSLVTTQNQTTLVAQKVCVMFISDVNRSYTFAPPTVENDNQTSENRTTTPSAPTSSASVFLPPALFKSINQTDVGIVFSIYRTASFFPIANASNTTIIASIILGASVVSGNDVSFQNLSAPVQFIFIISSKYNYSRYDCVSWDFNAAGGRGNWTTNGCITRKDNLTSNSIECQCSHLTNFAILVDISSRVNPKPQSAATKRALETITYIGVSLSLLGLAATIATLSLIKKKDISKYHIQLCCALFGMLLIFVIGIDRTEHFEGCVAVSVLIHYFTLVAVMWMGAEALLMFQKLVIVFVQITTRFIVILSLICWVTPLVPVIIPLAIDRNLLIKRNASDGYCFISNVTIFFAAFLGPILLILAFNAVIFIVVIAVLIKHAIKRSSGHSMKTHPIQLMANIISVIILFGLTWIFGALTITKAAPTFQIVFTLLNSFQGFFIFIIFCVLKKEIRSSWTQIIKKHGYIRDMRSSVHSILTTLNANTRSAVVRNMDVLSNADTDESIFTEEMKTLGPNVQLTRTLSLHKRHMEEVVKVSFDEEAMI
ncbi:hypothetical protein EMCRGX_G013970 [Ephydatia muelleri]